jgi:hypothetical protein
VSDTADGFRTLVASPLLIPHVRGAGGGGSRGGRRVRAGVDADGDFAVVVEDGRGAGDPRAYGSALAAAQGFNAELDRARRDGLASSPEPVPLTAAALLAAVGRPADRFGG